MWYTTVDKLRKLFVHLLWLLLVGLLHNCISNKYICFSNKQCVSFKLVILVVCEVSVETFDRVIEGAFLSPRDHKTFACLDQHVPKTFSYLDPRIHMIFTCLDNHVHKTFVCLDQHVHKSFTCLEQRMHKSFTCLTKMSTRLSHCFSFHVFS